MLAGGARRRATPSAPTLVFDEVQCGVGRTGSLWAYEQLGVVPDAMTLAKGLGGGMAIGALVIGEKLQDVFAPGDHGSTFAGGPVAAAAANAVLDVVDDPAFLGCVHERGERLAEGLRELPGVTDVRGRGPDGRRRAVEGADAPGLARRALLEEHLIINATGPTTLRFLPPLTCPTTRSTTRCPARRAARVPANGGWVRRQGYRRAWSAECRITLS